MKPNFFRLKKIKEKPQEVKIYKKRPNELIGLPLPPQQDM